MIGRLTALSLLTLALSTTALTAQTFDVIHKFDGLDGTGGFGALTEDGRQFLRHELQWRHVQLRHRVPNDAGGLSGRAVLLPGYDGRDRVRMASSSLATASSTAPHRRAGRRISAPSFSCRSRAPQPFFTASRAAASTAPLRPRISFRRPMAISTGPRRLAARRIWARSSARPLRASSPSCMRSPAA